MKIADFAGKNVCMLGYGREGKGVVAALEKYAPTCEITIADKDESIKLEGKKHWLQVGTGWLNNLEKFDVIIKSPGIPPLEIREQRLEITNSTQIFLDTIADRGATVIGVTGSKGKSTTSSLITAILKEAGKDTFLLGNIGEAAIAHLDQITKGTHVVLEMSSYQLNDLTTSPHIAVVTSFFPEHLDWHGSVEAYREAKANIARFQKADDLTFFAPHNGGTEIAKESGGRIIPVEPTDSPVFIEETHLIGDHNLSNIALASAVAKALHIPQQTIVSAVKNFEGLPHRLQSIGVHNGIEWIDDAISTTPESTIAALDALGDKVTTIILGGQDRGNDFTELAGRISRSSIRTIILFPGSGPRIKEALEKTGVEGDIIDVSSMEEAVSTAKEQSIINKLQAPVALLSTASPSYGMFKNFEEKGEQFQRLAKA
jgi:UDP-N-acetylmuramoyl-L-alanine---L-glutamate ligase